MSTYIIVEFTPKDSEQLSRYSALAAQTVAEYGGEFIAKGVAETWHGKSEFSHRALLHFANADKATAWYQSDSYQQLIPIREKGMHNQFHIIKA